MRWWIIGDSFVEGIAAPAGRGWAQRLAQEFGTTTVVDGVGGRCSGDVLRLLEKVSEGRFDELIVGVGLNDSRLRVSTGHNETAPAEFRSNLWAITKLAQQRFACGVHFVGLTRVDEQLTGPFKPDKVYLNGQVQLFDGIIHDVGTSAAQSSYIPVPVLADDNALLADGLHPSAAGHAVLHATISRHLRGVGELSA